MSEDQENKQDRGTDYYMGIGIPLGGMFGAALGVAWGNISIGLALGACAGVLIAAIMSQVKKKDAG